MKVSLLVLPLLALSLSGCFFGKNERESITKNWTPKTFFENSMEELGSGSPDDGIKLLEQLQAAYPGSKYAIQAKLEIAYALFKDEQYAQAIEALNNYIKLYPNHSSTPYAYYLRGVISEDESHSVLDQYLTDNAQRDIKSVRNAFQYYLKLINKFPTSEYAEEAKTRLVVLRNILARHELFVAIFYTKKMAYIAAINRSKYVISTFPNTPSVPASLHLMAHNYDAIGAKILAKDTRRVLEKSYKDYVPHYSLDD